MLSEGESNTYDSWSPWNNPKEGKEIEGTGNLKKTLYFPAKDL